MEGNLQTVINFLMEYKKKREVEASQWFMHDIICLYSYRSQPSGPRWVQKSTKNSYSSAKSPLDLQPPPHF